MLSRQTVAIFVMAHGLLVALAANASATRRTIAMRRPAPLSAETSPQSS